jgi:hypothetical protein
MGKMSAPGSFDSAPTRGVTRKSARRFAQDDAFLEGTEKHRVEYKKREKIEKVTGSRDDKGERDASMESGC